MFNYSANKNFAKYMLVCIALFGVAFLLVVLDLLTVPVFLVFVAASLTVLVGVYYLICAHPLKKVSRQIAAIVAANPYENIKLTRKDEFGLIAHFFNDVTKNVEGLSFELKEGERMQEELEIASQMQQSVLPKSIPVIPKLDTVAKTRSSEEVGGDSFAIKEKNGDYYIYIGDVTGHGAPAGLVMMMVSTLFDVYLPFYDDTYNLAVNINRTLKPRVNQSMFMTTSFFKWSPASETLVYTGCGHEHILIFRASEGVVEAIPAGGIALAMAEDITEIAEEKPVPLKDQDIVILYSDGITEAVNGSGELYGLERVKASATNYGALGSALQVFEGMSADLQKFVGDTIQKDDMTLICMRYVKAGYQSDRQETLVNTNWGAGQNAAVTPEATPTATVPAQAPLPSAAPQATVAPPPPPPSNEQPPTQPL